MLEKLFQMLLKYVLLPLLTSFVTEVVEYFKKKAAEGKTNKEIDEHVDAVEKATTREEQREALKKLVEGVRARRTNRV